MRPLRTSSKVGRYRADVEKLAWMQKDANQEGRDPMVVQLAGQLVHSIKPDDWAEQARRIHRWVRDNIRYQHDPANMEALDPIGSPRPGYPAGRTVLTRGWDDCDGKARLAVALARAIGMEAKVWPVWKGPVLAHVQAAYRWPGSVNYPGARSDGWVIGDVTIAGAELGQDPRTVPRNPETGRLPLS